MQKLHMSVALLQQTVDDRTQMLLRWQANRGCWEFIVADRLNRESFRESVVREVAWQLNLNSKSDFLVSNMAQLSMEHIETLPDESKQHVVVAFYNVHLYRAKLLDSINKDSSNRWVSAAEVCQGKTNDGQTIHSRVVNWINKWSVVQPWQ